MVVLVLAKGVMVPSWLGQLKIPNTFFTLETISTLHFVNYPLLDDHLINTTRSIMFRNILFSA